MIRTKDLAFKYDGNETVFHFPDIVLGPRENLLILGRSGIGKTTLLHLLAGLLSPLKGTIEMDGVVLSALSNRKMDRFRGQNMGLVFQKNHAIRSLSLIENLQARLFLAKKSVSPSATADLLGQLGLTDCKHQKPAELSEGQLQRLGIAMAMVHGPKVILADEPTSSLDDENCTAVMRLLIDQATANKANLIVITHDQRVKTLFKNSLTL